MNRKQRRRAARQGSLSRERFDQELTKAVEGDPTTDQDVAAFWNEFTTQCGVVAAVAHPDGIEIVRDDEGADR
jgi:hypothetical protein